MFVKIIAELIMLAFQSKNFGLKIAEYIYNKNKKDIDPILDESFKNFKNEGITTAVDDPRFLYFIRVVRSFF